jgi:HTH-type transcriptional regulator / antitoxin HipB
MTKLPNGKIGSVGDIGKIIREKRKKDGLTQRDIASVCNLGNRFLVDLENGKPTVRLDKTLEVLKSLGLEVYIVPRGWHDEVEK